MVEIRKDGAHLGFDVDEWLDAERVENEERVLPALLELGSELKVVFSY